MAYITAAFLRPAPYNLPASEFPDTIVESQLTVWQEILERACRQWFEERAAVIKLDGTGSDALHFSVPIIVCNSLTINKGEDVLDVELYEVYNNRTGYPDDRRNPRIKLARGSGRDIFAGSFGPRQFDKGRRNQTIDGTWGFTEADGSTPEAIKHALALTVIDQLTNQAIEPPGGIGVTPAIPTGHLLEEETDDHRMKWEQAGGATKARAGGLAPLFTAEVQRIITLYKSPIGMAAPADWTFGV